MWHAVAVSLRRLAVAAAAFVLVAVVAVGIRQASQGATAPPEAQALTRREIARRLAGAPPALGALHRQANEILPGARSARSTSAWPS